MVLANSIQRLSHALVASVLLVFLSSPITATTNANYAEMVTALTTMALDIAQKHYEFKDNSHKANILGILAATSSLANKGLFFHNNYEAKQGLGAWSPTTKDCLVQGIWGTRDLAKFTKNLLLILTKPKQLDDPAQAALLANLGDIETPQEIIALLQAEATVASTSPEEQSKSSYASYARNVIIFPILKGLTSFAIAYTQNYATSYSGDQARITASAAYSFVRLLEEYSHLSPDSKLNKPFMAAILAHFLWLGYETHQYELEGQATRGHIRMGYCGQCRDGARKSLHVLACNHAHCTNCLQGTVLFHYETREMQLHNIRCQEPGCLHNLTRNEVRGIVHNKPAIMRAYDHAAFNNAAFVPLALPNPVAPVRPPRPAFVPITAAARAAFLANRRAGNCVVCMDDKEDLQVLGCNHAFCIDCLNNDITAHTGGGSDDDGAAIDELHCMDPACRQHLTRTEIGCIAHAAATQKDGASARDTRAAERRILDLYDTAAYNRAYPDLKPADDAELREIAAGNIQICPNCNRRTNRIDGCNHMTCQCGIHYCYVCGTRYNPLINNGIGWGARACACPHFPGGVPEPIPALGIDAPYAPIAPFPAPNAPRGIFRIDLGDGNLFELDLERDLPGLLE